MSYALISLPMLFHFIFTFLSLSSEKSSGTLDSLRLSGISDMIYHAESFVFHYLIYMLGFFNQIFVMYGFPKKYDVFQYMDTGFLIGTMIISGIYATSLAMFINIITT